ncbi:amyloid protein-binding protein 2-like protein [Leptotrombidium deliense]|uniref:Amyloid protein-binding protein 2-like protein n=1 Tax=Leptotrombidium deliense TaxID=299467 RepID=A0A443SFX8_9ACAR|nr:amyloid protein-binding protein 2-like protein [Leptotrombidium deliense]
MVLTKKKDQKVRFKLSPKEKNVLNPLIKESNASGTDTFYELQANCNHRSLVNQIDEFNIRHNNFPVRDINEASKLIDLIKEKSQKLCKLYNKIQSEVNDISDTVNKLVLWFDYCTNTLMKNNTNLYYHINYGTSLSSFLLDGGWFKESECVLHSIISLLADDEKTQLSPIHFNCYLQLLKVRNHSMNIEKSRESKKKIEHLISYFQLESKYEFNLIHAYLEFSHFYFNVGKMEHCYNYCHKAVQLVDSNTSIFSVIDVLRYTAKACVYKKMYHIAELFMNQALLLTTKVFKISDWKTDEHLHPFVSKLLCDYSYYLFKTDRSKSAFEVCKIVLDIRLNIFDGKQREVENSMPNMYSKNMQIALAYYQLSYYEYSASNLEHVMDHNIDIALKIMESFDYELLTADAKAVKALILQEEAVDDDNNIVNMRKLEEAEQLHQSSLRVSKIKTGEKSVRTANYYMNIGCLNHTIGKFKIAKRFLKKAIRIQELFLGYDSFEIAVSYGQLASLYEKTLCKYKKAEEYYLKSMNIFGSYFEYFSGLEHHFSGLISVYQKLGLQNKEDEIREKYDEWKTFWLRLQCCEMRSINRSSLQFISNVRLINFEDLKCVFE